MFLNRLNWPSIRTPDKILYLKTKIYIKFIRQLYQEPEHIDQLTPQIG